MRYEGYFIRAGLSFVREVEEARHGRTVGTRDPPPPSIFERKRIIRCSKRIVALHRRISKF